MDRDLQSSFPTGDGKDGYESFIDAMPIFVVGLDIEGRINAASPFFLDTCGYTRDEIIGQDWLDTFIREKDRDTIRIAFRECLEKGLYPHHENVIFTKSGDEKYVAWTNVALHNINGNTTGTLSIGQDMTERRRLEKALRMSELKFRSIFESSVVGMFQTTPDGRFIAVNHALANMYGFESPEELITAIMNIGEQHYVNPEDRKRLMELYKKDGQVRGFEARVLRKDQSVLWVDINGRAVKDDNGQVLFYEGTAIDITKRKMLETQIIQTRKLESIGQLASGIAHEINTPTQYIGDNIHFLKDAFNDILVLLDEYSALLDAARRDTITDNLMARVEATAMKIDLPYFTKEIPKAISQSLDGVGRVSKIVGAMKDFSRPGIQQKTLANINKAIENTLIVSRSEWKYVADVVTDFDSSLPLVPCLYGEFMRATLNIIVNAAQAIQEKGGEKGTITITTRADDHWAEISFRDNGPGIPDHIKPRIFDPFFTTKEVGKGTGQGLAIAHSVIVGNHEGTLTCESELGKGATFVIRLPLGDEKRGA
jgi:PAS domain S-box-containing protein